MKTFTTEDHEIVLQVGEQGVLVAEALGAAGYEWQAESVPAELQLSEVGGGDAPPVTAGVGGSMPQRFLLTGAAPGAGELQLSYGRPWEPQPKTRTTIRVRVRPP